MNYRERLGRLKYQRDKLKRGLSRLHEDRSAILARFREAGIRSTKDLAEHPEWTIHARELRDVLDKSRRLENTVAAYSTAIVRVESVVRGLDREARLKSTKLSEEDLNLLSQTMHELDDQLRAASDIPAIEELELESLLERELP